MKNPYLTRITLLFVILVANGSAVRAGLVINEIVCGTSGDDWVEIVLTPDSPGPQDISGLLVTMYYGSNEKLSETPVTLYPADRPDTAWDDRFAVVWLTKAGRHDETDEDGDLNRNGVRDIYCDNYSSSLWNTDGIVALDTDDEPDNGMLDFAAWSNQDGSLSKTIADYVQSAINHKQWLAAAEVINQNDMIAIPAGGLAPHEALIRTSTSDTHSSADFTITPYQTPGRENLASTTTGSGCGIFTPCTKTVLYLPQPRVPQCVRIPLLVNQPCHLRLRVFRDNGMLLHEGELQRDVQPGYVSIDWPLATGRRPAGGLYLARIEAHSVKGSLHKTETVFIVAGRP